jgi:hypothetical protein
MYIRNMRVPKQETRKILVFASNFIEIMVEVLK